MFSSPKTSVKPVPFHLVVSDTPFLVPSAWPTGPVETPADLEAKPKQTDNKDKKKAHKSRKGDKDKTKKHEQAKSLVLPKTSPVNRDALSHGHLLRKIPTRSLVSRTCHNGFPYRRVPPLFKLKKSFPVLPDWVLHPLFRCSTF